MDGPKRLIRPEDCVYVLDTTSDNLGERVERFANPEALLDMIAHLRAVARIAEELVTVASFLVGECDEATDEHAAIVQRGRTAVMALLPSDLGGED